MSDYCKMKVIRYPFPEEILQRFNTKDHWDCEDYMKELFGDLWGGWKSGFCFAPCNGDYLDYVVSCSSDGECGDYGFSFELNRDDLDKYLPLFEKLGVTIYPENLRKVVFCWYDGVEPPEYYELSQFRPFEDL